MNSELNLLSYHTAGKQKKDHTVLMQKTLERAGFSQDDFVVEMINSAEDIENLRDEWNHLVEQTSNPLISYDWFLSCMTTFCPQDGCNLLALRSNSGIKAVAPLSRINRLGITYFEIPGTAELMEPTSLPADDISSFEQLLNVLLELKKPLILKRLILKPTFREVLNKLVKEKSFFVIRNRSSSQWIPIETSWEEFLRSMKSNQRSRLRRFRRRLEEKGKVEVEVYGRHSAGFMHKLNEAFLIEASGWKAKRGTAVLINNKLKKFFAAYVSSALRAGLIRLFLLKVNGKGIAMILGVEYARRFWTLKIGYDESWNRFAPGIILHHESIRWAFEQKLKGFEFLGAEEPWIEVWTKNKHVYYTYRLFPKSLNGLLCLVVECMILLFKKVFQKMR